MQFIIPTSSAIRPTAAVKCTVSSPVSSTMFNWSRGVFLASLAGLFHAVGVSALGATSTSRPENNGMPVRLSMSVLLVVRSLTLVAA
jgi:hypothetical protein